MRIEFSVDGLDEVVDALDELSEELLLAAIAEGMREGTEDMADAAISRVKNDSGELAQSISADEPIVSGNTVTGGVTAHAEYAVYVEMGTGPVGAANPHPAAQGYEYSTGQYVATRRLKSGKIIRFLTDGWVYKKPGTDEFVFTRGQPAKSFMYKAYQQEKDNVVKAITDKVKEAVER